MVIRLLKEGADRDAQDVNGYRPLHYATMWSHTATILALIKAGAALEAATRVDGNRPVHIAACYANAATVHELLRQGKRRVSEGEATPNLLCATRPTDDHELLNYRTNTALRSPRDTNVSFTSNRK